MKAETIESENIINYIAQWIDTEDWDALEVIKQAADMGCPDALEYMTNYIVSTGCINSRTCYDWAKPYEKQVEQLNAKFKRFSKKRRDEVHKQIFKDCVTIDCQHCNHVSFVHSQNEKVYPELLKQCWDCKSEKINIENLKKD